MHISYFIFWLTTYYLLFIFILDYKEYVRQKANLSGFLKFKFNMGHKAAETTCNIKSAFGPRTANKHTVLWWFKNCCEGDESLEDKEHGARPLKADDDQLRAIIKADPLKTK